MVKVSVGPKTLRDNPQRHDEARSLHCRQDSPFPRPASLGLLPAGFGAMKDRRVAECFPPKSRETPRKRHRVWVTGGTPACEMLRPWRPGFSRQCPDSPLPEKEHVAFTLAITAIGSTGPAAWPQHIGAAAGRLANLIKFPRRKLRRRAISRGATGERQNAEFPEIIADMKKIIDLENHL